eukprot:403376791
MYICSKFSIGFPCERYAMIAKNSIEVDPAYSDTKTKKTTIQRYIHVRSGDQQFVDEGIQTIQSVPPVIGGDIKMEEQVNTMNNAGEEEGKLEDKNNSAKPAPAYMDVRFTCDEDEAGSVRTAISSFVANMTLISQTMQMFGN